MEAGSEEYSPCIKSRFDQPGYNKYSKVESLLLKAMKGEEFEEEYDFVHSTMMMLALLLSKYNYKHWQLKY